MKLSICMMIKNEEKNLVRCLDKLKILVDEGLAELIIVDTGSDDNSVDIAKQYTDRVYFHKWNKNFSQMRNISISYAKGEWLLLIDADERLDDVDKLINLLKSKEISKYNTILFKVKNLYKISDENDYNLIASPRMFKNDGEFKYIGAVHNQPIFNAPVLGSEINITHFGYIIGDKQLMEIKFKRTSEILKSELEKSPEDLYYIYQLGVAYEMHGELKMALKELRKAYNILGKKSLLEKKNYLYILATYAGMAYKNNEIQECIKVAKKGLELEKEYIDLYYLIGLCEKKLQNENEAYKYLKKYLYYTEIYNELGISENINLIMYYNNEKYKSAVYYEIIKYYLKSEQYEKAYKIYNNVVTINEKIYAIIAICIPLKKYSELREEYNIIIDKNDKNAFLCTLEEKLKTLEDEEKINIYKEFSSDADTYALLNKIRLSKVIIGKKELTSELINKLDFNNVPIFYSEIFENIMDDINFITSVFEKIETSKLKDIVEYLIDEKNFAEVFEDYIIKHKKEQKDLIQTKTLITIADTLLLVYIRNNDTISEKYSELFKIYIEMGMNFVQKLYRVENSEEIYKVINNLQDRFFVAINIVNKLKNEGNIKAAIRYMSIAVNTYKPFAKYIGIYKDEIFNLNDEGNFIKENKEFDDYNVVVKRNIQSLIDKGSLNEAKKIIIEYKKIVKDDVETFSMESVIAIMENDLLKAEILIKKGLEIDKSNFDLNYNLAYLYEQNGKLDLAIEQYKKAKNYCNDKTIIRKIDEFINCMK